MNFAYKEHDVRKSALVKARLCEECSAMLNYGSEKLVFLFHFVFLMIVSKLFGY